MKTDTSHIPRHVPQVMVSSTFTDLKDLRRIMFDEINRYDMRAEGMEHDGARLVDSLASSLEMVLTSAGYVCVIGQRYGGVPECPRQNPDNLSVTELEFNAAHDRGLPILLFVMRDDYKPLGKDDWERDAAKEAKLNAFRERAKFISSGSKLRRVYAEFSSPEEFTKVITPSLIELRDHLQKPEPARAGGDVIPTAPAFYANPDYIGRNTFIGRAAQLQILSDWAKPSDPTSVLLFEAIGGNGKSMLTWEWTTNPKYAPALRDWAGRFWYSFYEKGAIMRGFCQHALAYMTGQPLETFEKWPMADLRKDLLAQLHQRPWLLILDGLERVLVAYHRIDASEVRDEEVNRPTDKILNRDPCDAIRDEDTDLLRALAAAAPSKILISSRLIPRVLLNQSGIPLPGVKPLLLPGLDEPDAEALLRSCGIQGTSADIRYYLTNYCANHPLVIGVLAGLINSPGPHRGDFDGWATDPDYGAKLNLASLDLIQSRNHILRAALDALEPTSRQLLSTLALLSDAVDYDTVEALNPHLPWRPRVWRTLIGFLHRRNLLKPKVNSAASGHLQKTIQQLEQRGLLQYDGRTQRYDLHPVVRSIAVGILNMNELKHVGRNLVDHFSSQPHNPYEQAKTIEDVENGLHVVRTLLKLGHFQQAANAGSNDLMLALLINLEGYSEILSLMRPFFSGGWDRLPDGLSRFEAGRMSDIAGMALLNTGNYLEASAVHGAALIEDLRHSDWTSVRICLANLSDVFGLLNHPSKQKRIDLLALDVATICESDVGMFKSRLHQFRQLARIGDRNAKDMWLLLSPMGRAWPLSNYRPGEAELAFALFRFWKKCLSEDDLARAEQVAVTGSNHVEIRRVHALRGVWRLENSEWELAAASFVEAIRMARERRLVDEASETGLALAKHHLGQLTGDAARSEAERLAQLRQPAHRTLALLWLALGDPDQAQHHALAAYRWAWADGEPYVNRYELTKTTELLQQMRVPIPTLPPYDPAKDEPFPWEADVRAAIEKLRAKKEMKKAKAAKAHDE